MWLASRPGDVLLWQQSGRQISFEHTSVWAAEPLEEHIVLPDEVEVIKARVDAIHPIFGDRRAALTIIGLPDACNASAKELQGAFCTKQEIRDWQRGETFADPWPKSVRKMALGRLAEPTEEGDCGGAVGEDAPSGASGLG